MQTNQTIAEGIAKSFNHCMRSANDEPAGPAKVIKLKIARDYLDLLKRGDAALILDNLPAVEASLAEIEAECRANGSFETYADMPRAERRRFTKALSAAK